MGSPSALLVEDDGEFAECLERRVAPRERVVVDAVDGENEVHEEPSILGSHGTQVALERQRVLLFSPNLPRLGGLLRVLSHALAGRAVLDRLHLEVNVVRGELCRDLGALLPVTRLPQPSEPVR